MARKTREQWETNRVQTLKPRKGKYWCWGCDAQLVGPGAKCPKCGTKNKPRRLKK